MQTIPQAALTPDQLAAIAAGGGYARLEDPNTHKVYHVIEQSETLAIDDNYVREKLAEAQADIENGRIGPWDVNELLAELDEHLAKKQSGQ